MSIPSGRRRRVCRILLLALAIAVALCLGFPDPLNGLINAVYMWRESRALERGLLSPDSAVQARAAHMLYVLNLDTGDSLYAHLSPEGKTAARALVLRALHDPKEQRLAARIVVAVIKSDMRGHADEIASCLAIDNDPSIRHEVARALICAGDAEAARHHLGAMVVTEDDWLERLELAGLLQKHGLGPVDIRLLTSRADGAIPERAEDARAELEQQVAEGDATAARALALAKPGAP